MILKMNKFDSLSNYRVFRLPGPLSSLDINDLNSLKETSMSPSQVNTSISSNNQDAGKQLLDACKIGDINEVKQLVDNGAPLSADWLGTSPLHLASQYGHTETVDVLLKAGASRDTRTKVDRTPLHCASLEGHLSIVILLLNNGAEIDAKDLLKMTPLHWAVERGHYDVVEYLLAHGSDVTLLSKFDKTPIDIAYDNGRSDMIPLLEKHVNSNKSKNNNQVLAIQNIKTRPTILPNKSNRNQKLVKTSTSTCSNNNNNLNDNSISSTNNNSKSIAIESIKKIMNNNAIVKKETNSSPNKITTRSSSIHNNTAQLNMSDAKEALQWLEKNGLTTASSTTSNGKDDDRQMTSSTNKNTSKNNIITIAVNNSNFNQLIKNSQSSPFVIINSNDLDDNKNKKVIKLDKVSSANKNNNTAYSKVESSDLDNLEMSQNERLKQEIQSVKSENKLLKEEMKSIKIEFAALKKDLERKEKMIDDFKKKFN